MNTMQATGKRGKIVIIDDILKGEMESTNTDLHKTLMDRYDSDWSSRADDENQKTLLMGTMWSNTDPLNVMRDRAEVDDELLDSKHFKYTEVAKSGNSVFIGIPALDENEESTCPLRFSTEFLLKKKRDMTPYLWQAVYQQDPIAPDGLSFEYSQLKLYDSIPKVTSKVVRFASLDPARRGKNYVTMPIFYRFSETKDEYYLVDCMYQKKGMNELYDTIVSMIVDHRLSHLIVENNTDTSLKYVLETKLRQQRYFGCTIIEKYSTLNKEQRIKDNQGFMRNNILYPKKGLFPASADISRGMEAFVSYSFEYPNKFDDFPDAVALFAMEYIKGTSKPAKAQAFNRRYLGI